MRAAAATSSAPSPRAIAMSSIAAHGAYDQDEA
jgi:hypothetical protein